MWDDIRESGLKDFLLDTISGGKFLNEEALLDKVFGKIQDHLALTMSTYQNSSREMSYTNRQGNRRSGTQEPRPVLPHPGSRPDSGVVVDADMEEPSHRHSSDSAVTSLSYPMPRSSRLSSLPTTSSSSSITNLHGVAPPPRAHLAGSNPWQANLPQNFDSDMGDLVFDWNAMGQANDMLNLPGFGHEQLRNSSVQEKDGSTDLTAAQGSTYSSSMNPSTQQGRLNHFQTGQMTTQFESVGGDALTFQHIDYQAGGFV